MLTDLLKISKIQNDENGKKLDFDKILVALQNAYDSAHGLDAFKIFAERYVQSVLSKGQVISRIRFWWLKNLTNIDFAVFQETLWGMSDQNLFLY